MLYSHTFQVSRMVRERGSSCQIQAAGSTPTPPSKLQSIYPEYSQFIRNLFQYRSRSNTNRRGHEISSYNKSRKLLGHVMRLETRGHCINKTPKKDTRNLLRTYCRYIRCSYSDRSLQKRSTFTNPARFTPAELQRG